MPRLQAWPVRPRPLENPNDFGRKNDRERTILRRIKKIGLLTPPLGLSVFAIKSTINDPSITLFDIFSGAFPFALTMLVVLAAVIAFPVLSLALI